MVCSKLDVSKGGAAGVGCVGISLAHGSSCPLNWLSSVMTASCRSTIRLMLLVITTVAAMSRKRPIKKIKPVRARIVRGGKKDALIDVLSFKIAIDLPIFLF